MAEFGLTCNGNAVTTVSELESATATHDPLTLVEIRCPALFPETSIECRNLLRVLGFNPLTIEVRGYLFTAVRGFIPNIERWKRACGLDRVPTTVSGRVTIGSCVRTLPVCELVRAIAEARAVTLAQRALRTSAIGSEIPARISSGHATPLDAATWSALTKISPCPAGQAELSCPAGQAELS